MSDERPDEHDPPTARLNLGDVKSWLRRTAQQASAEDADPAPEAPAVPEGRPRAEDADADLGAQDAPAVALDVGAIEPAPPVAGGDAHATTEPGGPPPADTFSAGQDAPSPAGFGQAGGLVPGVLPGSEDRSTIEAEAPPFDPEVGTGPDDHGPPDPAGVGEAGASTDDAPASEPEEDTGNESATDTPAEKSDAAAATAWSAPPTERSDRPEGDREVGGPGEGADVPPTVSAVADAGGAQETPADGWPPDDDDHVTAGLGRPRPEGPGPGPSSPLLPPADPGSASPDPPLAENIGRVEGWQAEPATPPDPDEGQAGGSKEAAASASGTRDPDGQADGDVHDHGLSDLGSAALFELDLAKLAERARASALREAVPAAPRPLDPGPEPDQPPITTRDLQDPFLAPAPEPLPTPTPTPTPILDPPSAPGPEPAPAPPPFPLPVTAPPAAEDEPGQPVAPEPAPLVRGDATQAFDLSQDEEDVETDSTEADTSAGHPPGKLYSPVQAAGRTRPAERPRYPRGQLREPIGVLRRIRAVLGIVVVTVLLGVAAGTAIGAFIFFLAFAVRNAITAQ